MADRGRYQHFVKILIYLSLIELDVLHIQFGVANQFMYQ